MPKIKYVIEPGQRFGNFIVINETNALSTRGYYERTFLCRDNNGSEIALSLARLLRQPNNKHIDFYHGFSDDPVYWLFENMKNRCYKKTDKKYSCYGGRGITICDEWLKTPVLFYKWAYENGYKKGLTIERTDNNKNYSPDNCIFTSWVTQANNKRNNHIIEYGDEKMSMSDFCRKHDLNYKRFISRINKYKHPIEKAMINCGHYSPFYKKNKGIDHLNIPPRPVINQSADILKSFTR